MKCPNCNETLLITERQQVEIDYCPSCRGVWLDRGELDKILAQADSQPYQEPRNRNDYPKEHRDSYSSDHKYQQYPKKKKSFLSDLFDFD